MPLWRSTLCRCRSSAPFPFLVFLLLLIVSLPLFDMRVVSGPFGLQIPDLAVYHSLRVSGATASWVRKVAVVGGRLLGLDFGRSNFPFPLCILPKMINRVVLVLPRAFYVLLQDYWKNHGGFVICTRPFHSGRTKLFSWRWSFVLLAALLWIQV